MAFKRIERVFRTRCCSSETWERDVFHGSLEGDNKENNFMSEWLKTVGMLALVLGVLPLAACGGGSGGGGESTYEVSATAGPGGTVIPENQRVVAGEAAIISVMPEQGFTAQIASSCGGILEGNSYTTAPITGECVVSVVFSLLAVPQNVEVESEGTSFTVSWDSVAGATGYRVYYGTQAGIHPDTAASYERSEVAASSSHTITDLSLGTTYHLVVTAMADAVESAPSSEASILVGLVQNRATGKLNDTGIIRCGGADSNDLDCPVDNYPSQDAQHGRDVSHNDSTDGHAGFSYTKVGRNGAAFAVQHYAWDENGSEEAENQWSCVLDNVTGLLWEVKVDDPDHLRHKDHTYSWYNPDPGTNGGNSGTPNRGTCVDDVNCDTEKLVAAVNATGLCGHSDWRLPTRNELLSLVNNSRTSPAIDTALFIRAPSAVFWSSSPRAADSGHAVGVQFTRGGAVVLDKSIPERVRLVRAGN